MVDKLRQEPKDPNSPEEKKLRQELEDNLGMVFATPEDIQKEIRQAKIEKRVARQILMAEIIRMCETQANKHSTSKGNRFLLFLCAQSINQLITELEDLKKKLGQVH